MNVTYNPKYYEYFSNEQRYNILFGGAGSGKSFSTAQKIIFCCLKNKERILCIRKFRTTIKNSVYRIIDDLISEYGLNSIADRNKTDMGFNLGESEILTSGLDDPEKIKSIHGITRIWIEEATELMEEDFNQLDLRLRGGTGTKQIILTFNPISEDHWINNKFFVHKSDDAYILHSTYQDNLQLDQAYKKLLEERMSLDENMYRVYVRGEWGRITTGMEFYKNFKYNHHVQAVSFQPNHPLHISWDFNLHPYMPCSIWQIIKMGQIYHVNNIDEIALVNPLNNTESVCREIIERYGNAVNKMFIYGDATGRRRSTDGVEHNYDIIRRMLRKWVDGSSVRVPGRNPDIATRQDFVNMIFVGSFPIEVRISPECKLMITDMENVLEGMNNGLVTKDVKKVRDVVSNIVYEKYGHLSDTLDYLLTSAFQYYYDELHRFVNKSYRGLSSSELPKDGRVVQHVS